MNSNRLVVLATVLLAALGTVGARGPQRSRAVRIESSEALGSMFPSWGYYQAEQVAGEPQGLFLRDGNLVTGDSTVIRYFASDGPLLHVVSTAWCTRLAGKLVALSFRSDSARWWLAAASRHELAGVRMVSLPDSLDAAALSALARLAAVNPDVGLSIDAQAALLQVLPLFRPRTLLLSGCALDAPRDHASLDQLETLVLAARDSGSLGVLPALPRLRRLALSEWDLATAGPLPAGLEELRSLAVLGGHATNDPSALRSAPARLEELTLFGSGEPVDLAPLARLRELRTLVLNGSECSSDPAALALLEKLEWIGLPANTTQRQFAAIVASHPDLRTIEVFADSVTDLAPMRGLKQLEALVLGGETRDLDALKSIRSLRYVGLQCDTSRASRARLASLRRALPDALVVPIAPFCLGSGWILLLIPATAVLGFFVRRTRRPRGAAARAA